MIFEALHEEAKPLGPNIKATHSDFVDAAVTVAESLKSW